MTTRRDMVVAVLAALSAPGWAASGVPRIGLIGIKPIVPPEILTLDASVALELRAFGLQAGRDYAIESRYTHGVFERSAALAKELIDMKVAVLLSTSSQVVLAAKGLTTTVPIVFVNMPDPVAVGAVSNLSHPGGNVTGTSAGADLTNHKQMELLAAIVPNMRRLALLVNPDNNLADMGAVYRPAASRYGIKVQVYHANALDKIQRAFSAMQHDRIQAAVIIQDSFFFTNVQATADMAIKAGIPLAARNRDYANAGVLFSYGEDPDSSFRTSVSYVAKILRGAKPGDLPVQQPVKFDFVVNAATARKLKLTIPQSILLRADEVLQ